MISKFLDQYKELREIVAENPELPIMFMASEECSNPDYSYVMAKAEARVETLAFTEERIYTDEDDLREDIEGGIWVDNPDISEEDLKKETEMEMKAVEWTKAIVIYIESY
ncbi:hypothetical protein [Acetobacterium wieringae]|uniref:hypothetical protein n=1 Tax=Acetobacterium wieringae TaxID=52694 RepID=UPI003158636E